MTVAHLDDTMSVREFFQWIEYSKLEPLGEDRIEYMIAQLTALTVNINSKKKVQVIDFLISLDKDKKDKVKLDKMQVDLFRDIDKLKRG